MINTVLFDLDGTLLPMDVDEFTHHYFKGLCNKCASIVDSKDLSKAIWFSTEKMVKNIDGNKTNMEVFMETFSTRIDVNMEDFIPLIDEYYYEEFKNLKFATKPIEIVIEIVEILKKKNYKLVIATNPLFPRAAILHRIDWTGLDPKDFSLITDYESSHFCKPNIEYFEEILSIIEKKPEECLMIGNDVQEDLVANTIGIKTFLIENHMINREDRKPKPDFIGSYKELLKFVEELPCLKEE